MSTMNRLHNCKNPHQGEDKKVLCVCSAGLLRSPTAARVLAEVLGHNTRSAGITKEYALIPVDEVLIQWADEIIVMESWMAHEVQSLVEYPLEIYSLEIPDQYGYMDRELQAMILKRYSDLEIMKKAQ